jgi:hypothetical protein
VLIDFNINGCIDAASFITRPSVQENGTEGGFVTAIVICIGVGILVKYMAGGVLRTITTLCILLLLRAFV